jgi:hypothetical protein
MPVNPALAITIPASSPLYRITAISFHTPNPVHHKKVVNGMGARKSHNGALQLRRRPDRVPGGHG